MARGLWARVQREYGVVDAAGLAVLEQGLRSLERAEAARKLLDRAGCVLKDRFGQVKAHPAAAIERDSRAAFLSAIRLLGVDVPLGDAQDSGEGACLDE